MYTYDATWIYFSTCACYREKKSETKVKTSQFQDMEPKARQRRVVQRSTREDMQESKLINEHQKRYAEIQNHPITPDDQTEEQKTTGKKYAPISIPGRLENRPGGS